MKKFLFYSGWVITNISVFMSGFFMQKNNPELYILNRLGYSVYISRGAGLCLTFLPGLLLIPMCRHTVTFFRSRPFLFFLKQFLPDISIQLHSVISFTMVFWATVHAVSHIINFYGVEHILKINTAINLHYKMIGGATGHIMALCLLVITITSILRKKMKFEIFWYSHHLLFIFYLAFLVHGTGCFVKTENGKCVPYYSAFFVFPFLMIYTIERLFRETRASVEAKDIIFSGDTLKILFEKKINYKSGQYILLKCDEISIFQWHPFTISSSPTEKYMEISIRCLGDWTFNLRKSILNHANLKFKIDGPFGSPIDTIEDYESAILIASGIGITPFISVIKGMCAEQTKLKKIELVWVNQDARYFEWFNEELRIFWKEFLKINFHMFLTEKIKTIERIKKITREGGVKIYKTDIHITYGRPDFDVFFKKYLKNNDQIRVGVFVCGGKNLQSIVKKSCEKFSNKDVNFVYKVEKFN